MLRRLRARLTFSNIMAATAVMVALGGTSYAATRISNNSVRSTSIVNGQVKTQDLANHAVTAKKLAADAVTSGAPLRCQAGDAALGNRGLCAFKLHFGGGETKDWAGAIQACRARGSTPARLPTAAEFFAYAPLGGSPFKGIDVWTADPAVAGPVSGNPPKAWSVSSDVDGNVATFEERPLTSQLADVACIYSAADVE
jgi:hypothetical protein